MPLRWLGKPPNIFEAFESFGDNCEFGFVQNANKARNIGLFKFARTSIESLIRVLETRFSGLLSPADTKLSVELRSPPDKSYEEYNVVLDAYGIDYHAGAFKQDATFDEVRATHLKRLALLSRKMIEDLEDGAKIFVFKPRETPPQASVDELVARMRRYGPAPLLWVSPQEEGRRPGHVEELRDGLLHGFIDRFAPYDNAIDFSPLYWPEICRKAHQICATRGRLASR